MSHAVEARYSGDTNLCLYALSTFNKQTVNELLEPSPVPAGTSAIEDISKPEILSIERHSLNIGCCILLNSLTNSVFEYFRSV